MKFMFSTLLAMFLATSLHVTAQTIKGRVVTTKDKAVSYATVQLKHSPNTTATNGEGYFEIKTGKLPDTLIVTSVGFESNKIEVTAATLKDPLLTVKLNDVAGSLSDVVVTGYAAERKREIAGAVSTVITRDFAGAPAAGIKLVEKRLGYATTYNKEKAAAGFKTGNIETPPSPITPQSGDGQYAVRQLTAGEVNDFNKWKMWEDFSQSDFKTLSEKWQQFTTQRYCVLLQNKQHAAIVDKQVYLLNGSTGDTVWKAVTDNTGKAELWASVNKQQATTIDYKITCAGCETYNNPTQFADGINSLIIDAPCDASNNVDIAFVVDATGSMGDEIEFLKTELENILDKGSASFSGVTLNAASVFYRDKGDEYLTRHSAFDSNLATTYNYIQQQSAGGGGDLPEAVNSALRTALDSLQWSKNARARLLFLVLDAPPHDEARDEMFTLMKRAAAMGIRIIPVVCSGADKATEFVMRNLALTTNGTYVFLTDDSGIGDSHIKPTTDHYTVELLTNLLQRLIKQMTFVNACNSRVSASPFMNAPANKLQLKVVPNPTQGMVTIKSNKEVREIYVTDFTGKILLRVKDGKSDTQINLADYPAGVYLVKYITTDNIWGAEKVVLIH